MTVREHVSLGPYTTFQIGGAAQLFVECASDADVSAAVTHAHDLHVPVRVLGGGGNVLVPDMGFDGMVVRVLLPEIACTKLDISVGAGVTWDDLVRYVATRDWWGVENLAGIPGTVGGAVVQNIGAYGAELSEVFIAADCFDIATGVPVRIEKEDARFGYRTSIFKQYRSLVILQVHLRFSRSTSPNLSYADLARAQASGTSLTTPHAIGEAVRDIRSRKFPDLSVEGTAGSFFKNPVVSAQKASDLGAHFPELPRFPQADGRVKVSLAWLLDHALSLKGMRVNRARLFERQPLVIVADRGASFLDVDTLAREVETRVFKTLGIEIEREVELFV